MTSPGQAMPVNLEIRTYIPATGRQGSDGTYNKTETYREA